MVIRTKQLFLLLTLSVVVVLALGRGFSGVLAKSDLENNARLNQDSRQGYLGVFIEDSEDGVAVTRVQRGSPAAEAGVRAGDIIISIDGTPIESAEQVIELVRAKAPGDEITLLLNRPSGDENVEVELTVTLGARFIEEDFVAPEFPEPNFAPTFQLGVQFRSLTPEIAAEEGLSVDEGALVVEVLPDTPAADAGLEAGDIITAVDGDKVDIERTLSDRLYAYEREDRVLLTVLRGEEALEIGVVLAADHPDKNGSPFRVNIGGMDFEGIPGFLPEGFPPIEFGPDFEFAPFIPEIMEFGNAVICRSEDGDEFRVFVSSAESVEDGLLEEIEAAGFTCEVIEMPFIEAEEITPPVEGESL